MKRERSEDGEDESPNKKPLHDFDHQLHLFEDQFYDLVHQLSHQNNQNIINPKWTILEQKCNFFIEYLRNNKTQLLTSLSKPRLPCQNIFPDQNIIAYIFSFLPSIDLLRCIFVCKQFQAAALEKHSIAIQSVFFEDMKPIGLVEDMDGNSSQYNEDDMMCNFFYDGLRWDEIEIFSFMEHFVEQKSIEEKRHDLQSLTFSSEGIYSAFECARTTCSATMESTKKLEIAMEDDNEIFSEAPTSIKNYLQLISTSFPKLEVLNLPKFTIPIYETLETLKNLKKLQVFYPQPIFGPSSPRRPLDCFSFIRQGIGASLKKLVIHQFQTDACLEFLMSALYCLRNLKILKLYDCDNMNIEDVNIPILLQDPIRRQMTIDFSHETLPLLPNLKVLVVKGPMAQQIAAQLAPLTSNLKKVKLNYINFDDLEYSINSIFTRNGLLQCIKLGYSDTLILDTAPLTTIFQPQLTQLELKDIAFAISERITYTKCPLLKRVKISFADDIEIKNHINALGELLHLEELWLETGQTPIQIIGIGTHSFKNLKKLKLSSLILNLSITSNTLESADLSGSICMKIFIQSTSLEEIHPSPNVISLLLDCPQLCKIYRTKMIDLEDLEITSKMLTSLDLLYSLKLKNCFLNCSILERIICHVSLFNAVKMNSNTYLKKSVKTIQIYDSYLWPTVLVEQHLSQFYNLKKILFKKCRFLYDNSLIHVTLPQVTALSLMQNENEIYSVFQTLFPNIKRCSVCLTTKEMFPSFLQALQNWPLKFFVLNNGTSLLGLEYYQQVISTLIPKVNIFYGQEDTVPGAGELMLQIPDSQTCSMLCLNDLGATSFGHLPNLTHLYLRAFKNTRHLNEALVNELARQLKPCTKLHTLLLFFCFDDGHSTEELLSRFLNLLITEYKLKNLKNIRLFCDTTVIHRLYSDITVKFPQLRFSLMRYYQ